MIRGKKLLPRSVSNANILQHVRELVLFILKYMVREELKIQMEMDGIIKRKGYNMNNWIRLPAFRHQKQDSVKFYVFKDISYSYRMMLYLILLAVGFVSNFINEGIAGSYFFGLCYPFKLFRAMIAVLNLRILRRTITGLRLI